MKRHALAAAAVAVLALACSGVPPEPSPSASPFSPSEDAGASPAAGEATSGAAGGDVAPAPPADRVADAVSRLTLEQKAGQLLMPYVYGAGAQDVTGEQRQANLALFGQPTPHDVITAFAVGGVVYLDHNPLDPVRPRLSTGNVDAPAQIAALSAGLQAASLAATGVGLLIGVDQEGGRVQRIGPPASHFPPAAAIAGTGRVDLSEAAARVTGTELASMGVSMVFAPVADVAVDPGNRVIGDRSFGRDPALVADHVAAQVRGFAQAGVLATAKHFPGHGDTSVDSHTRLPVVDHDLARWRALDAPPFAAAVAAGVPAVMLGHLAFPAIDASGRPATLSPPLIRLLREELGFDGLVVTDALWMGAIRGGASDADVAVQAVAAGADLLLMPPDLPAAHTALVAAVRTGALPAERVDDAVRRVLAAKARAGVLDGAAATPAPAQVLGSEEHRQVLSAVEAACGCSAS